jgi:ferrous iron transport protein A
MRGRLASSASNPNPLSNACLLIINRSYAIEEAMSLTLDQLPFRTAATVTSVAWNSLTGTEARRLRNLGLDDGVSIELLHAAPFGSDPLAIRIGRMMVAVRRAHARAIVVEPEALQLAAE